MKHKILLILILSFSLGLYIYKLGSIPPAAYVDEATVGYNAYSILTTGTDEYGQKFPLIFRFFGAYTPGLFVYSVIPIIKIFGLNLFSIRLLSAIMGAISVFVFYKTLSLISKHSLWGTLFYAIVPWTVFNSRLGYEVMFAATIFNAGCYFLLKNLPGLSYLGLFLISLSTYAAHTQRYLGPLFLLGFLIIYKKFSLKPILFLLFTQIPNLILTLTPAFWVKSSGVSLKFFIFQIISYLSPKTLFFQTTDIDLQHQMPLISVFFWWMIIPLVVGIKKIFVLDIQYKKYIILWLICSLIPASLSGEFISIQRALPLLFPLMLIISLGLTSNIPINSILFIYSLVLLLRSYYLFLPNSMSLAWNYGYQELSNYISQHPQKNFLIDNTRNPRNYILPLFYLKTPYQNKIKDYYSAPSLPDIYHYSNMTFKPFVWGEESQYTYIVSDGLSISSDQAKEHNLISVKKIITPDNQLSLEIFKVNGQN